MHAMMKYIVKMDLLIYYIFLLQISAHCLPPLITTQPPASVVYKEHDRIVLPCEATTMTSSGKHPHYYWRKNGELLAVHNQYVTMPHAGKGTLLISSAIQLDEGFYQCFVETAEGTSMSRVTAVRQAVLSIQPDQHKVSFYTVYKGVSFNLTCMTSRSYPQAQYYWEVAEGVGGEVPAGGAPVAQVRLDNRIQQDSRGGLYFAHMKMTDGGRYYRCVTYNAFLQKSTYSSYSYVTLKIAPRTYVKPKLVYSDPSWQKVAVAVAGQSLTLQCLFDGYPTPIVSWEKQAEMMPLRRYSLLQHGTVLKIHNVSTQGAGNYSCTGTVTDGSNQYQDTYTVKVVVQSKPEYKTPETRPMSINVTDGASVSFICDVTGNPKPKIEWFINSVSIQDLSNHRLSISNDRSTVSISHVCANCKGNYSDIGVIQCNASNQYGFLYSEAYLNIVKAPLHLEPPVEILENAEGVDEMTFNLRIGTIVGATLIVSTVISIVAIIYCKSKKLEKELKTMRMTILRRQQRGPNRHYNSGVRSVHNTQPINIIHTTQTEPPTPGGYRPQTEHPTEGRYQQLSPTHTEPSSSSLDSGSLHPGSYQQLIREEENEHDGFYKYDYTYEENGDHTLYGRSGIYCDSDVDKYSRPSSSVHAYVDILGAEEWNNNEMDQT